MSSAEPSSSSTSLIGADLRAARLRLGWELPEVAAWLRIRLPHLLALEDGRIADLPGNAYAVGYLRTYAGALGLDADDVARRFRAAAMIGSRKTQLEFPAPVPDRGVPAGAVVLLGIILATGGYVAWYRMSGDGARPVAAAPAVPDRLAVLVDPPPAGLPPPPPPVPAPPLTEAAPPTATLPTIIVPTASPPVAPSVPAPSSVPAPPSVVVSISPSQAAAAAMPPVAPAPSPGVPAVASPAGDGGRMVLRARAEAWVQVRDHQGQVLLNRLLRANETWAVPNRPQLLMTTGNAGGMDVLVDGIVAPGFGGAGAVRRDVPLDPDLIKAGRLPIQTAFAPPPGPPVSTPKPPAQ